jgi:hypothetical protein
VLLVPADNGHGKRRSPLLPGGNFAPLLRGFRARRVEGGTGTVPTIVHLPFTSARTERTVTDAMAEVYRVNHPPVTDRSRLTGVALAAAVIVLTVCSIAGYPSSGVALALIPLLIGLVGEIAAHQGADRRRRDRLRSVGVPTDAEVTFAGVAGDDGAFEARYHFEVDGVDYHASHIFGLIWNLPDPERPAVGQRIPIVYDPDDPRINGWIDTVRHSWAERPQVMTEAATPRPE